MHIFYHFSNKIAAAQGIYKRAYDMTELGNNLHLNISSATAAHNQESDTDGTSHAFLMKPSIFSQSTDTRSQLSTVEKKENSPLSLRCMVCADISSGKHYGVLACNGCSGFFKRSVRRKLIYRCQAITGTCIVDKAHRNQCQACRLRKCLESGMNKHAVQNERQPRNLATVKLRNAFPESVVENEKPVDEITFSPLLKGRHKKETMFNGIAPENIRNHGKGINILRSETERYDWGESLQNTSFIASPTSFCCTSDDTNLYAYTTWKEPVYESSARILFLAVRWARNLPAYANLAFRDQVILLEETWPKLFIIGAIQWSMPLESSPLFVTDESLRTQTTDPKSISVAQKTLQSLQKTLARFKHFGVDLEEFACLKAILLFQGDTKGLKDANKVETLQDHAQLILSQHVQSKPDETLRFGRLLLLLQNIYEVRSEILEYLFFYKISGSVPIEKMLCDMFKY